MSNARIEDILRIQDEFIKILNLIEKLMDVQNIFADRISKLERYGKPGEGFCGCSSSFKNWEKMVPNK